MNPNQRAVAAVLSATVLFGTSLVPWSESPMWGGKAAAAVSANIGDVSGRFSQIYNRLTDPEKASVQKALTKLRNDVTVGDTEIIAPVWNRIKAKLDASSTQYPHITQENILEFIKAAGIPYDPGFTGLDAALKLREHRTLLFEMLRLSGLNTPQNDISFGDIAPFADDFENRVKQKLQGKSAVELLDIVMKDGVFSTAGMIDIFKQVFGDMLKPESTLVLSRVLYGLGITAQDLIDVRARLGAATDPDQAAQNALAAGYVRSQIAYTSVTSNRGRTVASTLKVWNYTIPSALIRWEATGNSKISVDTSSGTFALNGASPRTQETVTISAYEKVRGSWLYSAPLTMTYIPEDSSSTGTGTGTGTGTTPAQDTLHVVQPNLVEAGTTLDTTTRDLQNRVTSGALTGQQALAALSESLRSLSTVNISSLVTTENNTATVSLKVDQLDKAFTEAKDIANKANELWNKITGSTAKPIKAIVTLDLGNVNPDTTKIPIPKAIIDSAKAHGLDAIAFKVNGVSLTIDLKDLNEDVTLTIKIANSSQLLSNAEKKYTILATNTAAELKLGDRKQLSKVYTIELTGTNSKPIQALANPVEIRLPVTLGNADKELTVLAKIDPISGLQYLGGKYDEKDAEFRAKVNQLSTYVVIENKVAFSDISSVKSWAGRQIDVIAAKGFIEGRAQGEFVPGAQVTRAEFAKMIVKTFGLEDPSAKNTFTDVSDRDWFAPYVAVAAKAGLVEGREGGKFDPNAPITRAEMATIASRALIKLGSYAVVDGSEALKKFTDQASIHPSLTSGVALAAKYNLVVGDDNSKFNPNDNTTRAQAAVVIYRLFNL